MARHRDVIVIGMGRFGRPLAETLIGLQRNVLGVDRDAQLVRTCSESVTQVVEADARDEDALRQLGAGDFPTAVVAIGGDIEASLLATYALVDLGVEEIWTRALTAGHADILRRIGATSVVFPERDMGVRVAHSMVGRAIDYLELEDGTVLLETTVPRDLVGRSLSETRPRSQYGVTVLMSKTAGGRFEYASAETKPAADDLLLVTGDIAAAERFAELN